MRLFVLRRPARSGSHHSGSHRGGRLRLLACQQVPISRYVLVVFRESGAEKVSTLRIRNKVDIVRSRWLQSRAQRSFTGISDGSGR